MPTVNMTTMTTMAQEAGDMAEETLRAYVAINLFTSI